MVIQNPSYKDLELRQKIKNLEEVIQLWAKNKGLWSDSCFKSYFDHYDDEPDELAAVVTVLCTDGDLNIALFDPDPELQIEFDELISKLGFWYECHRYGVYDFYAIDENLNQAFIQYFEWQWISNLIKPNYTDLYNEIFEYFSKQPKRLHSLEHRKFEILISEILRNQGYTTILGKGVGDGGVDITISKKDDIDEIITLVQVKKYKEGRKISLEAVNALDSVVTNENANRGLFITTSGYLPSVKKFADRKERKIILKDLNDIKQWCDVVNSNIVRDKSVLISDELLLNVITKKHREDLVGKVVVAYVGHTMILPKFYLIIKDSSHAVLLMELPSNKNPIDSPYNTRGYSVPILDSSLLEYKKQEFVFRAKKMDDGISFWGRKELFVLWDSQPQYFDYND